MTDYHFVSSWRLQAPIERVWEEVVHTERWPGWWKYVHRVDQLDPGDADGLGKRLHLVFTSRLPYRLGFDVRVRRVEPPTTLEADATGELEGVGRWTLTPVDGGTLVRYDWDVRTTRWWMNLAAPVARPLFTWNHDALMREAAEGLARRLDAELELLNSGSRPGPPARAIVWSGLLVVLLVVVVGGGEGAHSNHRKLHPGRRETHPQDIIRVRGAAARTAIAWAHHESVLVPLTQTLSVSIRYTTPSASHRSTPEVGLTAFALVSAHVEPPAGIEPATPS